GAAEAAIREAVTAVEATERPVKVETEIVEGRPTATLLEASRSAAMLCVGAVGIRHLEHNRVGSTAAALVADAHCPVAIV
ncbi:MAG: universal stress protein, partial [Mycobacterium sp.]|nr:universal stress protein [Mycobacterium sp.]